ncbi:MAG: methyltransferase [Desulfurococcaceae archaeon]
MFPPNTIRHLLLITYSGFILIDAKEGHASIMPLCISVHKSIAEKAIKELRKKRLINENYKIERSGEEVIIPLTNHADDVIELSIGKFNVLTCTPTTRTPLPSLKLPSLDVLGDVVIIREKVTEKWNINELVVNIRRVYPRIKAIWVKEETVDYYRRPLLKLLWGEDVKEIIIKEHGLKFKVKLGEVYFNPRLSEEHHRIAQFARNGEIVIDAFSGVGGFALHIATSKYALVIANDLNPVAYDLLVENIELNRKRVKGTLIPLNLDTRELPSIVRKESADRLIADLPLWSIEFKDIYSELLRPGGFLHLYKLSQSPMDIEHEIKEVFEEWDVITCKLILEYAPRAGIYRCDLIKR